ncbi:MAG: monofunctional biosynthetic peptidoglycan transglycosylase [Nitrospirae bacterium]|nr:monofunctional biosynthetic peptidoglycan transglycosylase [Nitrospirota bacterium]
MAKKRSALKRVISVSVLLLAAFIAFHFVYPDVTRLRKENPKKSAFMEYREAEWARAGKKYKIRQVWVPYGAISPYLIKAVLIGEDDKFWQHEGFDYEAMQKAIEKDIKAKKFKLGGSTISQQLAKNLYLSPSKNPLRKFREAIITWRMERALPKKRLLELYLNVAEWSEAGIFGIEAASRHYYGKSASALGPEEASRLAAVLPNPRKFNPLGSSRYVVNRSGLIYNIMVRRGIVVPELEEVEKNSPAGPDQNGPPLVTPIEETKPSPQ